MKKFFSLFLVLILSISLFGCDSNGDNPKEEESQRELYKEVYGNISDFLLESENWNIKQKLSFVESDFKETTHYDNIKNAGKFFYFASLLYKNNNFPIIDKPVEFKCDYDGDMFTQKNTMAYMGTLDRTAGNVKAVFYGTTVNSRAAADDILFLHIDVNYNFTTNTVESYELYLYFVRDGDQNTVSGEIYLDGVMKSTNENVSQETKDIVMNYYNSFLVDCEDVYKNDLDFSSEYKETMEKYMEI